jgi:hypothetical protein
MEREQGSQSDHDLLVRIDEQVKQMRISFDQDRIATRERAIKQDADLELYKREVADRIQSTEEEISSLKMSRAQFYAISGTIAFIISVLIKVFWK